MNRGGEFGRVVRAAVPFLPAVAILVLQLLLLSSHLLAPSIQLQPNGNEGQAQGHTNLGVVGRKDGVEDGQERQDNAEANNLYVPCIDD